MRLIVTIALCLVAALPTVGYAQDIVELNEQGIAAFKEGRFGDAAQKFNEAYALKPEPPLKKNEALAWFKAERCDRALPAAEEYLALGVDDDLSKREAQTVAVRCHIIAAESTLAAGEIDAAEAALMRARTNAPTPEDEAVIARVETEIQARRDADEQARQAAIAAAEAERAAELAEAKRTGKQRVGLGIAGTGAAILVGALVYHVALATGTSKKFKEAAANGDDREYDRLGKKLETGNIVVPTLYGLGLATTGVGVYLWWSARQPEASNPAGSGRTLGVTATVHF